MLSDKIDWLTQLNRDAIMAEIISQGNLILEKPHQDIYLSLLSSIISQQLSTKVARVIKTRFLALFPDHYPQPESLLIKKDEELRGVGLSFQKIGYIRNVANFYLTGGLNFEVISALNDEDLIKHLTEIKGVGRWTAQMVLMFTLGRPDVFPMGDLGIQNAIKKHYNLSETGPELMARINLISQNWRPHRTIACRYLWQSLDND